MIWVIQILAIIVIWLSFWSLIPRDEWWIRGADFPRLQILVLGFIAFVLFLVLEHPWTWLNQLLFVGLMAALAYQLKMVLPYTFIWKKTGQAGQAGSAGSATSDFPGRFQCTYYQYQISFTDRADPDSSARSGFDSGNRSKLAKCTLGD